MWWILFWGLAERSTPAAPQPNSSCLQIDHFRETETGSVAISQHYHLLKTLSFLFLDNTFAKNSWKNYFFQGI